MAQGLGCARNRRLRSSFVVEMAGRTLNRLLGTVVVATVAVSALAGALVLTRPAAAQWGFDDRFGFPGGDFWRRRPQPSQPVDSSRAPAATRKPDPAATTTTVTRSVNRRVRTITNSADRGDVPNVSR